MHLTARRAAVQAATTAQRQLRALVITAPETVRARFRGQSTTVMVSTAARLRPTGASGDVEVRAALSVLRTLARRVRFLTEEAAEHERDIRALVRSWRPDLLEVMGVGPIVAATMLAAWSHPGRVRDEAAFAILAGTAPIPASPAACPSSSLIRLNPSRSRHSTPVPGSSAGRQRMSEEPVAVAGRPVAAKAGPRRFSSPVSSSRVACAASAAVSSSRRR